MFVCRLYGARLGSGSLLERAGELDVFSSAWTNDHLDLESGPVWEGWTGLAALAHLVPGKQVGHLVLANPFRRPVVLAKSATLMDHATRGRFGCLPYHGPAIIDQCLQRHQLPVLGFHRPVLREAPIFRT